MVAFAPFKIESEVSGDTPRYNEGLFLVSLTICAINSTSFCSIIMDCFGCGNVAKSAGDKTFLILLNICSAAALLAGVYGNFFSRALDILLQS